MKRTLALFTGILMICSSAYAYRQKEISVYSQSMSKDVPVTVITPDCYKKEKAFPVIYLLHGFSDNHTGWAKEGVAGKLADLHDVIFVIPDGGYDSWYFDSTMTPEYQYETFVSKELIEYVDSNYKTIRDREARAITGLSMGGHGALYLAFRHQDVFGSAGSTSGGVDIRPFPDNWNIKTRIGSIEEYP